MDIPAILISQYHASLEMLKQTITRCPELLWNSPGDKAKFWHIAYHALFYTHLYLQDSEQTFTPWIKHRDGSEDFEPPQIGEPYNRDTILEYLAFCQQEVAERVPRLNLEEGFNGRPYTKLELQIYSIRHLMQHTGELMERLGAQTQAHIDWVGSKHG